METTIKLFGNRIKEIRKKLKLTQEQLSEKVGLDVQTISRIETGYYFTSYENLEKLAIALNVDIKDLFNFQSIDDKDVLREKIENKLHQLDVKDLQKVLMFIQECL